MMFLRSSGSSLSRLTNSTCMWMPFCCLVIKHFKVKCHSRFDRYFPNSTNNFTRKQRVRLNRVHKLTPMMPAPAKPVCDNTKNKIQLNAMLVEGPLNSDYYTNATQKHTLTTAVVSGVPVEIVDSVRIDRHGLCSTPEEADIIITQHAISCLLSGKCGRVVCDDTDVFVLLVHFYHDKCRCRNSAPMIMSSLVKVTSSYRHRYHCNRTQRHSR